MIAWELVGFPDCGTPENVQERLGDTYEWVRIKGGRALYDSVEHLDANGGYNVRLSRLDVVGNKLHVVVRYVDPDTELELLSSDTSAPARTSDGPCCR